MFKKPRPFRKAFIIMLILVLPVGLIIYIDNVLRPSLYSIARVMSVQMATEAVNTSVQRRLTSGNIKYQDLMQVHKDQQGRIVMMQADTVKINEISSDITLTVQSTLKELQQQSFYIPLGMVTGSYLLANVGPGIKVNIVPMGTVRVVLEDKFEQAGINQTRHSLYLAFETDIIIVVPFESGQARVNTTMPVAETIIVGDVPETFVSIPSIFSGAAGK